MQEALPIMHQKLGSPATVLAKNAHVRTGQLQGSASEVVLCFAGAYGRSWGNCMCEQ